MEFVGWISTLWNSMRKRVKFSDIWGEGRRGTAISALFISEFYCSGAGDCSWGGFGTDVDELFSV